MGKEGLADATGRIISDGATKNNSYDAILEKLYPLAAGYNVSTTMEMTVYAGRVHKDNLKDYYPLFMDGILRPVFNADDFKRIKDETLNYLNTTLKYSSDEELGKAVLYISIFSDTPYGHIVQGTISGVKNITLDDVKEFYKKYYTFGNCTIGIGGGYSENLITELDQELSTLPKTEPGSAEKPKFPEMDGLEAVIVNKDASATGISIGYPIDVLRGSKEWYALEVADG